MIHYAFESPRMRSNIAPSWESFKDNLLTAVGACSVWLRGFC